MDWDRVVPLTSRDKARNDYASLQVVRAYWDALRDEGALPRRDTIDPRGMGGVLEHVFMLERVAPCVARFRLAGSRLTQIAGIEVRGMPLTALLEPEAREAAMALTQALFSEPAIVELVLEAERGLGRPMLEGRMILLPVLGDEGVCDRALGCLVTHGQIGRSPRRFAIARQHSESLGLNPRPVTRELGFAEPAKGYEQKERAAPQGGRPYLRLVKTDG